MSDIDNYDEYKQWLDSLQIGDEVAVVKQGRGHTVSVIERITPSRQFKLKGMPNRFNSDGKEIVDRKWGYRTLEPVTDRIRGIVEKAELVRKISAMEPGKLTLDQLRKIEQIINE